MLTSPFAAKCADQAATSTPTSVASRGWPSVRVPLVRASLGVTVAVCAKARNAQQLGAYITERFPISTALMLPRSSLASPEFEETLREAGYAVTSWIGYENTPKKLNPVEVNPDDVLVLIGLLGSIVGRKSSESPRHSLYGRERKVNHSIA